MRKSGSIRFTINLFWTHLWRKDREHEDDGRGEDAGADGDVVGAAAKVLCEEGVEDAPGEPDEETAPVEVPAPESFKPGRLVAVAITSGALLGSLCAVAFTTKPPPTEVQPIVVEPPPSGSAKLPQ